nr:putative LAGLIDADG homing endonuclease [Oedogonium sp. BN3]
MDLKDEQALQQIKQKLGGSVKLRAGSCSVRYRLHNKKGIIDLISRINGHIRNSVRIEQFKKICNKYNIVFIEAERLSSEYLSSSVLTQRDGWFAGFFDADGTITMSIKNKVPQLTISVTNKKEIDVLFFKNVFGGNVYFDKSQNGYYKWSIQRQKDVLNMLEYFKKHPSRSSKKNRLYLVPFFYSLKKLKAYSVLAEQEALLKAWQIFQEKWKNRS